MKIILRALATLVVTLASAMAAAYGAQSGLDGSDSPPPSAGSRQASSEPTPFCKGYKDGFRRGYCRSDTPCGRGGETRWCRPSYYLPQTYEAGYARGLEDGKVVREQIPEFPPVAPPAPPDEGWKRGVCDVCTPPLQPPDAQPHP